MMSKDASIEKIKIFQSVKELPGYFGVKWKNLIGFAVVFQLLITFLIKPIAFGLSNNLLRQAGIYSLRMDNLKEAITKPAFWGIALVGIIGFSFILLFELSTYVYLSSPEHKPNQLWSDFGIMLKRIRYMLLPRRILVLCFLLPILLVISTSYSRTIVSGFQVPKFIQEHIFSSVPLAILMGLLMVIMGYLGIRLSFVFHGFINGGLGWRDAFKQSFEMTKKREAHLFVLIGIVQILTNLFVLILRVIVILLIYGIIMLIRQGGPLTGLDTTLLLGVNKLMRYLNVVLTTAMTLIVQSQQYQKLGGKHFVFEDSKKSKPLSKKVYWIFNGATIIAVVVSIFLVGQQLMLTTVPNGSWWNLTGHVEIVAHRGSSRDAPENTLAAVGKAVEQKADRVEIDVQLTKDGKVVLFHDATLKRIAGRSERMKDLTYAEIEKVDAGSWFDKKFKTEKIPTLDETLDKYMNLINFNIELKPDGNSKELAEAVVRILKEKNAFVQCDLSSLDKDSLLAAKKINPQVTVGIILPLVTGDISEDDKMDYYSIEAGQINGKRLSTARVLGRSVYAWTINDEEDFTKMRELQVDGIITDDPILARKLLTEDSLEVQLTNLLIGNTK